MAPKLRSRVDLQKYHAGAALLRNFFVDYSGGGASTRPGTKFINKTKVLGSRLIPFQPSSTLSYVLEFGQNYIRFYSNGAPILENATTGGTGASGDTFTIANSFAVGDWVFAEDWGGLTNVNGNYFIISSASGSAVSVTDLFGNAVVFTGVYTSGGQLQRVYTIPTPYNATDLFPNQVTGNPGLKWVQDVTSMIICHPSYQPAILTIVSANNWTFSNIAFGPTIATPGNVAVVSSLTTDQWGYAYIVTSVDKNGQESGPSIPGTINNIQLINTNDGTNTVTWNAVPGAQSYNVYKALPIDGAAVPSGAQFGFVSNVTDVHFQESTPGIAPDMSQTPPIIQNPFLGASVQSLTLTGNATYTSLPTVVIDPPAAGGVQATAYASLTCIAASLSTGTVVSGSGGNPFLQVLTLPNGIALKILGATFAGGSSWLITIISLIGGGSITSGGVPATEGAIACSGGYTVDPSNPGVYDLTWQIGALVLASGGSGYTSIPNVTISGGATATATLNTASGGNPGVPAFLQERLMLAGQAQAVQSYNLSQPASFFNFNISNPSQDDDAISGTIISEQLNDIRWLRSVPTGIIAGTGKTAWLINGGGGLSTLNPITPSNQTASPQAFNGANDLQPQQVNFDLIYGTNKGSYFRDLTYNIYANIYTGTDISSLSNHLFFGYNFLDITWAEEPFKTMWIVRNDGTLLSLGFVKDQELIGWAHHDTNGQFKSVCSVIETVGGGNTVDATYVIVNRFINNQFVEYVERFDNRYFTHGYIDAWSVDCGLRTTPNSKPANTLTVTGNVSAIGNSVTLSDVADAPFTSTMATNSWRVDSEDGAVYEITAFTSTSQVTAKVIRVPNFFNQYTNSAFTQAGGNWALWQPVTTVTGLTQLVGQTVTGVADGAVVAPTVVNANGTVTLSLAASKVTLGLAFLPQLKTLPLDLGEPTAQSKRKKLPAATLRVADTLGLQIGTSFANAVTMKDLQIGAIPSTSTGPSKVIDLVNPTWAPDSPVMDALTVLDQLWQEPGQVCVQQNLPYPATILAIMPDVVLGDTK